MPHPDILTEQIAPVVHEAIRAYQRTLGEDPNPPWEQAPEWIRASVRAGIRAVLNGTARTPEQQHENFLAMRLADGWTYGPVKNAEARTHPCLVPYADLPIHQRRKDLLFQAVVLALSSPEEGLCDAAA